MEKNNKAASVAQGLTPDAWSIWQQSASKDWVLVSPSGDAAHCFNDDQSPLAEVVRQLCETLILAQAAPPAAPAASAKCVCGDPASPNTVHRTDGPCYQADGSGAEPADSRFDLGSFYNCLSATREARKLNWKQVSQQTGVSQSTLTRMAQGRVPNGADMLVLMYWMKREAKDFVGGPVYTTPPAAEAASQPGEMGAGVPESTNQGEQKCQSKLSVMLLRSVAPVTQDNTSLGDVSRSTSIGAANSMVGSAIRTGDGEAQNYRTADGMPTERAVLEREWRKMRDQLAALPAASAQQDEREAGILGPDADGLPIARYSHRAHGMAEHPNGTWIRYGEVAGRIRAVQQLAGDEDEYEALAHIEHHKGGDNLVWDDPGGKRTPLVAQQAQAGGEDKRIADLEADRDSWRNYVESGNYLDDKRDAERYRWLRSSVYSEIYLHNQPGIDNCKDICGDSLDAAIDAALSREQPQGDSNG